MDLPAVCFLCLEQGDCSLKGFIKEFLNLANQANFPDDCLCSFLIAGLNTTTRAQLSREGPRGSLVEFEEWVLVSGGLPITV